MKTTRSRVLQGTLDMLIMQTLRPGPLHGRAIGTRIRQTTEDVLQVEHGSLYPALHRLERQGLLAGKWESRDGARELKYYRLTAAGRKQLARKESAWRRIVDAIGRVMAPPVRNDA